MAIKTRNKIGVSFNSSSMSDLVFLLLIFFMLTSTLIAPNAIKLLLPSSSSRTMAPQSLYVNIRDLGNEQYEYIVGEIQKTIDSKEELKDAIRSEIGDQTDATITLSSDKTVPVQHIVNVLDVVNQINKETQQNHKVILATSPN